jgi:hypothetical protein
MTDSNVLHNPLLDSRAVDWRQGQSTRTSNLGSITYWYRRLLSENGGLHAREIAEAALSKARSGSPVHILEITERTDGKVASELNFKGVMVHVGDDYAKAGLAAARESLAAMLVGPECDSAATPETSLTSHKESA